MIFTTITNNTNYRREYNIILLYSIISYDYYIVVIFQEFFLISSGLLCWSYHAKHRPRLETVQLASCFCPNYWPTYSRSSWNNDCFPTHTISRYLLGLSFLFNNSLIKYVGEDSKPYAGVIDGGDIASVH